MKQKVPSIIVAACCLYSVLSCGTLAQAKPSAPYALKTISVGSQGGYDVLRLYNTKSKQTIWTRRLRYDPSRIIAWSEDGRALAIYLRWNKILIWRLGYKTRFYDAPREEDFIMGFVWSPDKRRLLIDAGHSGADMSPVVHLFCLVISERQTYSIAKSVGKAKWISHRKVRYSILDYDDKKDKWFEVKSRVWCSP
jgi:hypothetical protein